MSKVLNHFNIKSILKNFNEVFYLFVFLRLKFPMYCIVSVHLNSDLATFQLLNSHMTTGQCTGQRQRIFPVPGMLLHSPLVSTPAQHICYSEFFLIPFQSSPTTYTLYRLFLLTSPFISWSLHFCVPRDGSKQEMESQTGFKSWHYPCLATWTTSLASLTLSFLACELELITVSITQGGVRVWGPACRYCVPLRNFHHQAEPGLRSLFLLVFVLFHLVILSLAWSPTLYSSLPGLLAFSPEKWKQITTASAGEHLMCNSWPIASA